MSASEVVVTTERKSEVATQENFSQNEVPPASFYIKQPKIFANLVLMSMVWLSTSFGYYLILTLINTFDKVYVTAFTSSFSEAVAYIVSGLFYEKVGVKLSLGGAFTISAIGGLLILFQGKHDDTIFFFISFLFAKFGVTCCFNINFVANAYFFPVLFAATALGICNFLARFVSSFSFVVS